MASKKHGVGGNERSLLTSRKKKCRKCAIGASDTSGVNGGEVEVSDKAKVLKKGPWTAEEDGMLIKYVKSDGERNWKNVQKTGLMRCGKSCRLRWTNHLRPDLKKGPFSFEEEKIVVQLHQKLGNRWSKIAAKLPGRTDNEVKNFWNTKIKKRIVNDSLEISEQNSSSPQQNEVNQTPSNLTLVNSPTPQNPHMNLNPNPSINPQTTFPHFNPTNEPSFEHGVTPLRSSTMHKDPIMSFPNNFSNQFNSFDESEYQHNLSFAQNVSRNSSLNNQVPNPFPRTHLLDFGTNSAYYYPNPLPETQMSFESSTIVLPSIQAQTNPSGSTYNHRGFLGYLFGDDMWSDSLSFEPDITLRYDPENDGGMTPFVVGIGNDKRSFFNGGNCYYEKHSKFEVKPVPEEEVLEDYTGSIDDELLSLLNTFTNDGSPPELHLAIGGENMVENTTSSYSHFYLDQPLYAFTSFSGAMDVFASRSDSIPSTSSDLNRYIDGGECV